MYREDMYIFNKELFTKFPLNIFVFKLLVIESFFLKFNEIYR